MNNPDNSEELEEISSKDFSLSLFKKYLDKENFHLTYERKILFDEISNFNGPFCVEDLIEKCSPDGIYISRGTIYKTVKLMEDSGVIQRIPKHGKKRFFVLLNQGTNKGHLICLLCGKMETIDIGENLNIEGLKNSKADFDIISTTFIINGICSDCG